MKPDRDVPGLDARELLARLWDDYVARNPHAAAIHEALRSRGETVRNDHVAFRTFDDPRVSLDVMAAPLVELGWEPRDAYSFPEKKLRARHYEHADPELPKAFLSELRLEAFSDRFREIVERLLDQAPADALERRDLLLLGRPWRVSFAEYEALREESEYGAWLAAFGFCANHFTVDVNALHTFDDLAGLDAFLESKGFALNRAGGEIKGSPEAFLEQSSTLAGEIGVRFSDRTARIPSCYYEFARRYRMPDGRLFTGFVEKSADRIFESTDRRKEP